MQQNIVGYATEERKEARMNLAEAIRLHVEDRLDSGERVKLYDKS